MAQGGRSQCICWSLFGGKYPHEDLHAHKHYMLLAITSITLIQKHITARASLTCTCISAGLLSILPSHSFAITSRFGPKRASRQHAIQPWAWKITSESFVWPESSCWWDERNACTIVSESGRFGTCLCYGGYPLGPHLSECHSLAGSWVRMNLLESLMVATCHIISLSPFLHGVAMGSVHRNFLEA